MSTKKLYYYFLGGHYFYAGYLAAFH